MPYKDPIIPYFKQSHNSSNFISNLNLKEVSCDQSRNSRTKDDNDHSQTISKESENQLAIILGYYNGEDYISDQLVSIFNQTHPFIHVFIFDDASNSTINLDFLKSSQVDFTKISIGVRERNIGFAKNFLNALSKIDEPYNYFAFSDQDDIWHHKKIQKALETLKKYPHDHPALYCARTEITEETCNITVGNSPLFTKPPSFANALVQSIAGGNTMVFNKAARDLIAESSYNTEIVSHDWWCYQIISGAGGTVIYDREPCLKYRQHSKNLVGANMSWKSRIIRLHGLLKGRFRDWNDINISALVKNKALLTRQNQANLDNFIKARNSSFFRRLLLFIRSGIYRQTLLGNLGLLLGITINKV